ncbi:hypothetical protein CLAVI_000181 [Candidatus Clavichlamydia salmonicola]|uniref:hypothetical protein n=1 Tax=Candidatus Clavichlamydia salmonicola TaxID=469812 RepID=UPI0018913AF4|nr:hypothetical protein [Candidatus Clavichlamydia salmonicola]MBF5050570.1 hypothetical protein [Candidatus Clavichlamydia salmonicola]
MVVLGLLGVVCTAGIFYGNAERLKTKQLEGFADRMAAWITLTQQLSLIYDADTQLVFNKKDAGYTCQIICPRPLPIFINKLISKDLPKMYFDQVLFNNRSVKCISFDGSLGGAGPIGELRVVIGKYTFDFTLKGFPSTIYKRQP